MKSPNTSTNVESTPKIILRSHVPEESGKNEPPLAQIRERAFEIHIERGGIHGCDLDDWLQAEREFQEKTQEQRWGAEEEMTRISTQSSLRSSRPQLSTRLEENRMLKNHFQRNT